MKKIAFIIGIVLLAFSIFLIAKAKTTHEAPIKIWQFQSIDTMKFSRDLAREKLNDPTFDEEINNQVKAIAMTGATHVGIATPYDKEFYPILRRWVDAARKNNLKVWFRGNFSGWEEWFDYKSISREEHLSLTKAFIAENKDLFMDGDIFSACPECENGGPGDPRQTGDIKGHQKFLIDEYKLTKESFRKINKDVASNYASMNADVARAVMDKKTTKSLDGIVTIDHYVTSVDQLVSDVVTISRNSGGKIVLGEIGAPIPDLHGSMTEKEQAAWVKDLLIRLAKTPEVVGLNYWVNIGGSTQLWEATDKPRLAVTEVTNLFSYVPHSGFITNDAAEPLEGVLVRTIDGEHALTDKNGQFVLPFTTSKDLIAEKDGYISASFATPKTNSLTFSLKKINQSFPYRIKKIFSIEI